MAISDSYVSLNDNLQHASTALNDSLRTLSNAFSQAANACTKALSQISQASANFTSQAAIVSAHAVKNTAIITMDFSQRSWRAHYNIFGKYTFPIEQEITYTSPPAISEINPLGQICSLGILGTIPLTWVLSLTALPIVGNSLTSAAITYSRITAKPELENTARPNSVVKHHTTDQRNWFRSYVYGLPGVMIGGVIGATVSTVDNSIDTSTRTFAFFLNAANVTLSAKKQGLGENDKRPFARAYIVGLPGLIIGGVFGLLTYLSIIAFRNIMQFLAASAKAFRDAFCSIVNLILPDNHKIIFQATPQNWFKGVLGLTLGLVISIPASALIVIARSVTNSIATHNKTFISFTNLLLDTEDKIKAPGLFTKTNTTLTLRSFARQFLLGAPGLILGTLTGTLSLATVAIGRMVTNSSKSALRVILRCINLALPSNLQLSIAGLTADQRPFLRKYILGAPGLVLGSIFGVATMGLIYVLRVSKHNFDTAARTFVSLSNLVLHEDDSIKANGLNHDDPRPIAIKILTLPGFLLGAAAGLISALTISVGRIITNSSKSFKLINIKACNLALHVNQQIDENIWCPDNRTNLRKYLIGLPGVIFGGLTGALAIACIGLGRITNNSIKTFSQIFIQISNKALYADDKLINLAKALSREQRSNTEKYILGLPGIIFGSVAGATSFLAITLGRIVTNNVKSAAFSANITYRYLLNQKVDTNIDNRIWPRIYVVGAIGLTLGVACGAFGAFTNIFLRYLKHNALSVLNGTTEVINLAIFDHPELQLKTFSDDARPDWQKFGVGSIGCALGAVIGAPLALITAALRIVKHTLLSAYFLTGSFLNVAFENVTFLGLGNDDRLPAKKAAGALGYLLAAPIAIPVSALLLLIRKLPLMLGLGLGVIGAGFVFPGKCIALCQAQDKFATLYVNAQAFKNLYSSLSAFGKLPVGASLVTAGDGKERTGSWLRKCFTFNAPSLTERAINQTLNAYRDQQATLTLESFTHSDALQAVEEKLLADATSNCLASQAQIAENKQDISNIMKFLRAYFTDNQTIVPPRLYSKQHITWRAAFWSQANTNTADTSYAADVNDVTPPLMAPST